MQEVEKVKVVRKHLQAAHDRQWKWADQSRRPLQFEAGDKVFLNILPTKGCSTRFLSQLCIKIECGESFTTKQESLVLQSNMHKLQWVNKEKFPFVGRRMWR